MTNNLTLGTAKITAGTSEKGMPMVTLNYMNHGNFTKPEPRGFWTEAEAREWCADRGLRVIS